MKNFKIQILTLVLISTCMSVKAYDFHHRASSGHILYYNITQRETIPYTAEVTACPIGHCYEGNIIIPDTVKIEDKTYFITSIAPQAFAKSTKLYAIELPNTLVSIGNSGFRDCINLRSITFPESLTYIGSYCLVNCVSLQSIGIPKNIDYIGTFAFGNCKSLYNIYVDLENTQYSSMAGILFDKQGNELIHYPAMREGDSFDIPGSVVFISDWAFCGARQLKYIHIPESVVDIGRSAFWGCKSLSTIEIPNTIDVIKSRTFYDCWALSTATVHRSTRIVTTAFPPFTKIRYIGKRNDTEEELQKRPVKRERIDIRPIALPLELYALYIDTLPSDLSSYADADTKNQKQTESTQVVKSAIVLQDINIEEVIELQQMHGDDYSDIKISNSPTGDDKDDVVKDDELEVSWPVMDEDLEYYLSDYEKGKEEKVEYLDPKHANRNRKRDGRIQRKYTMYGNEI